jgi:hypothetical protein
MRYSEPLIPPPPISPTSAPALKSEPAPVRMMTRTASSSWHFRNAFSISVRMARRMAFLRSGRLMVTVATPFSMLRSIAMSVGLLLWSQAIAPRPMR